MSVHVVVLTGGLVVLEPLDPGHVDDLVAAASDGRLWELWYTTVPAPEGMAAAIAQLLAEQASGTRLPFVVRRPAGAVVGSTTYLNIEADVPRLEIGSTWTAASAQRTGVNAESKLLLLGHAFEAMGAGRVQLKTDVRNERSQRAIARLGARYEGTLRRYQRRADGSVRDTVMFSVTAEDWPEVRRVLRSRLAGTD